ncbi:DUF2345 domain-containing protein, partial [Chromobacterium violaceum]|uniref:DUF2345 domain-containing protein n=1 Tax=Chromobacterium violaceum TaxID=536 RepID=UPI001FD0687B
TVSAGQNLNLVAQRDANHTTGRRWLHNVGQHISLFVAGVKDKVALKLIAAKGKVQVQAQSDRMEITADKDVTITSVKQKVQFNGKQEILLTSGGAYVRIKDGKIELHAPGTISVKGASHDWSGPASKKVEMPYLPGMQIYDEQFQLTDESGEVLKNVKYELELESGRIVSGKTDVNGMTNRVETTEPLLIRNFKVHM